MQFINFGLLPYFLPLVAIPIILHLLTLHRLKTVELSTFRFLFDSYIQQRRRMKFLEALIALLRTLFLLFLIFSIARPVVTHWDQLFVGSSSPRDVVLLIDGSASMGAVTEGETSMQRAQRAALEIVSRLGRDDRVTIVRVGAKPVEVCSRFNSDAEVLRNEIESLKVSPSRANLLAAFSQVFGSEARPLRDPIVYLLSDLQSSGWDEFGSSPAESVLPEETELIVVNVGSKEEIANRAVIAGAPDRERAIVGLPIKLRPQVANYSTTDSQDVEVSFIFDDKEVERQTISLKPGETGDAEFIYTPTRPGAFRARYQIPGDRFEEDDAYLFTVDVMPRVKVLLINGNPAAEPLDNEGLYLQTAMLSTDTEVESSGDDPQSASDAQQELLRSLDIREVPQSAVNEEVLRDTDAVILANCGALNPAQFKLLCHYVAQGGGLVLTPGHHVKPDPYNKHLFPAPEYPERQLMAAKLGALEGDPNQIESFQQLDSDATDFGHPIFSVFADAEQKYFAKVKVYRRFAVAIPDDAPNTAPLARFANGQPALIESHFGDGKVLLTAFPFNTKWGNLPLQREFVPLVLRMIEHVKRPADLIGPSVVAADGAAEFVVAGTWSPASGKVTDVKGRTTPLTLERSNSRLKGAFDQTFGKGYYTVEITGGSSAQPRRGKLAFAVNLAAGESNFEAHNQSQVTSLFPGSKLKLIDASAEAQQSYGSTGNEFEIWRTLIILLFLIIAAEFLLSTVSGRGQDAEQRTTTGQRIRNLVSADQELVESHS